MFLESFLSLFMIGQNPLHAQSDYNQYATTSKYDSVLSQLQQIANQYANNAEIITIGSNDQGVPIRGLKIGKGNINSLVVATHHGNEYGSTSVAMGFAQALAQNPIANQTVYVIPVLNIGGYNKNSRYENNLKTSVDPNRDYPSPCKKDQAFQLSSTHALAQFLEDKNIQISATLHTYFPAVVYPWGISTTDLSTPYDEQYKKLVGLATQDSGYQTGNNTQVLYPADGTFEDYAYWKHGIWSLLFELGFSHFPDNTAVKNMVDSNVPGLRRFLENSPVARVTEHNFSGHCDSRMPQRVILE